MHKLSGASTVAPVGIRTGSAAFHFIFCIKNYQNQQARQTGKKIAGN